MLVSSQSTLISFEKQKKCGLIFTYTLMCPFFMCRYMLFILPAPQVGIMDVNYT